MGDCLARIHWSFEKNWILVYISFPMWNAERWKRIVAVFALFFVLFNYPLITVYTGEGTILGFPRLYFSLFALWLIMILLLAWHVERPGRNSKP